MVEQMKILAGDIQDDGGRDAPNDSGILSWESKGIQSDSPLHHYPS